MLFRAKRFKSIEQSEISPAAYNFQTTYNTKACCVPFNCSAPAQALTDNHVPAPCTYNLTFRKHRVQGGVSLKFSAVRDSYFRHEVRPASNFSKPPLPSKYTIPGKLFKGKLPRYNEELPSTCKLGQCFVVFTSSKDNVVYSPPVKEEIKQTLPVYYDFPCEVNSTTLNYKGNFWSKRTSIKETFIPDTPGVGAYDLLDKPPKPFDVYCNYVKFCKKLKARSLRSLDLHILRLKYLDEPGPADYEVVKFDEPISVVERGTFSKAEREPVMVQEKYEDDLNIGDSFKVKSHQTCWPPFNSSDKRAKRNKSSQISPADIVIWNHTIAYKVAKELSFPRVVAPFNSSNVRTSVFGAMENNPGPASYDVDRFPLKPRRRIYGEKDANSYEPPLKLGPACISLIYKEPGLLLEDHQALTALKEISPCTYELDSSFKYFCKRHDFHKGAVWRHKKTDRSKWLINKNIQDLMYMYDVNQLCRSRCKEPTEFVNKMNQKLARKVYRNPPVSFFYTNRMYNRVKAVVLEKACRGKMSPFLRCATTGEERIWN